MDMFRQGMKSIPKSFPYRVEPLVEPLVDPLYDDQEWNTTKNATRLSAVLGPWTVYSNLRTDTLDNHVDAYLSMYVMCDGIMSANTCSLPFCEEVDNNICVKDANNAATCKKINETIVDWADAIIYFYLEYTIDLGFPLNYHETKNSGDIWVGPYHILFSQNPAFANGESVSGDSDTVDEYFVKYLIAPDTAYIKMPVDCDMMEEDEFYDYLGQGALEYTVQNQAAGNSFDDAYDPFYKTCENGDIIPVLPYVSFKFVASGNSTEAEEEIEIDVEYKLLVYPKEGSALAEFFPTLKDEGFPVDGPYCYDDDPERGWVLDLSYDSAEGSEYGTETEHSCVEDYECVPPQLDECDCTAARIGNYSFGFDAEPSDDSIGLDSDLYITLSVIFMGITSAGSIYYNLLMMRKIRETREILAIELEKEEDEEEEDEGKKELEFEITVDVDP